MKNLYRKTILSIFAMLVFSAIGFTQTTEFTYQGSLRDGANPANANYDFEFLLFDSLSGGTQIGLAVPRSNVAVAGGIFAVTLDFGIGFPGANRFLEIRVRNVGGGGFTILAPRQMVGSSPYSVKSLNAETATTATTANNASQLGGVAANQFVLSGDTRLSDARTPTAGSSNYVQNTAAPQAASNFNVSGNGTAGGTLSGNAINSTTQYNIGGNRALSVAGTNNVFAGVDAGGANTSGNDNSFFGRNAGASNTTGSLNSFFGRGAGNSNTTGFSNSFFGRFSGFSNTTGFSNSFFGNSVGQSNTTGESNAFFGAGAGLANTTGSNNSFFGRGAGDSNTLGFDNSFFGRSAGSSNTTGNDNSFFGREAGAGNTSGIDNSFFGRSAGLSNTTGNHNAFFGRSTGQFNTTGIDNSFFGRSAGGFNTTGANNSFFGRDAGLFNTTGASNSFFGRFAGRANTIGTDNSFFGTAAGLFNTEGTNNSFFGRSAGQANTTGNANSFFGYGAGNSNTTGDNNTIIGNDADVAFGNLTYATALGAGAIAVANNTLVLGRPADTIRIPGDLRVLSGVTVSGFSNLTSLSAGSITGGTTVLSNLEVSFLWPSGTEPLCRNAVNQIAFCSSSLRYKQNVHSFGLGLSLINRLRPVSFNWQADNKTDLGLIAEEVAEVEPLLVTTNKQGEIEGVKYDRVGVVLVNAVKEQQAQIEQQQMQIEAQQKLIDGLKKLVCSQNPQAEVCIEERK